MDRASYRKISYSFKYFFFSKSILSNYKRLFQLIKTIRPFFKEGLIKYSSNTYSYIFRRLFRNFLSVSLTTNDKLDIFSHHFNFLTEHFSPGSLHKLFNEGISLFSEADGPNSYAIKLVSSKNGEYEGLLSLAFTCNDIELAVVSFTIAPGKNFGLEQQDVAYVTRLQKSRAEKDPVNEATKYFKDIFLTSILLKALEAMLFAFDISTFVGVSAGNQVSGHMSGYQELFFVFYDETWITNGGILKNGEYILSLPLPHKSILLIKQTHRNRTVKKRNKLKEIYDCCLKNAQLIITDKQTETYLKFVGNKSHDFRSKSIRVA
jgi:uncharacterized protein VirK/YbjX